MPPYQRIMTMTATILLTLFAPFFQGTFLDKQAPRLQEVLEQLTADPQVYVAIADEAFADFMLHAEDPSYLELERTVAILKYLLFFDGRSELALLEIAELAYNHPEHADEATNALAALANFYKFPRKSCVPLNELEAKFEKYMTNPVLFHNARECRNGVRSLRLLGEEGR